MENNPSTTYCGIRETTHPSLSPSRTLYSRVYRVFASVSERFTQLAMDLGKFHLMSGFFLLFFYFCKHETHRSRGRHHLRGSFRESGCTSHARRSVLRHAAGLRRLQRRLGIPGRQNGARRNPAAGACPRTQGRTRHRIAGGKTPELLEHEAARWLTRAELHSVNWLPADVKVVEAIEK